MLLLNVFITQPFGYLRDTLKQSYKRTPYIFCASSESKNRLNNRFDSRNKPRLYKLFDFKTTRISCTDEVRVKVPSVKNHTFYFNIKHSTVTVSVYIFVGLKMLLTALIHCH